MHVTAIFGGAMNKGKKVEDADERTAKATMGEDDDTGSLLSPVVQEVIGSKLRRIYAEVVAEPLPPKFGDLLKQLSRTSDTEENR
jgi:Anti-sigma factor NepR